LTAPRRRPSTQPAGAVGTPPPRRRLRGGLVAGLILGVAVAAAIDRGRGERWRTEAVVGLEDAGEERDLAVEARLVDTTRFREAVRERLAPSVRAALAQPSPVRRWRADAQAALAAAAERLAGPSLAETLKTRLPPGAEMPATLPALQLAAELGGDGRTLVLAARAPVPDAATAVAEAAGAALVDARTARRREALERRLDATEAALADTRARIAAGETALARGDRAAVVAARDALAEVETRLERARAGLAVRRADRRDLASAAEPPRDLATLTAHPRGGTVAAAARARDRVEARVAELDDTYGERHPVRIQAEAELAARENALAAAAGALVAAARRAEDRRAETVAELEAARERRATALAEREAAATRRDGVQAEIRRHRERLDVLADTRAELVARRAALTPDARVLLVGDVAATDGPAARAALYGGGAAGGLVLGGLVGLLRRGRVPARLDGPEDLALATTLPVVGTTAAPGARTARGGGDEGLERLALRLEGRPQPARILALLTPEVGPASGRVAVALARVLARERLATAVVALAADPGLVPRPLRRDGGPDLDAVLREAARWSDALQTLGDHGPWLLAPRGRGATGGPRPPLDALLGELARRFDRVLVAGGGLERAETLRAARACQSTLVLVARRRTRGRALTRGLGELEAVGVAPDGLVLLG
jgi:uncharacterized protein involved in exopolysaccharide biosynthesis